MLQYVFLDLLLWAVVHHKYSLARKLWEQTEEPLRAAIIIQVCLTPRGGVEGDWPRHARRVGGQGGVAAAEYERWAVGVLDRVPSDKQQIMDLLTRAPMRKIGTSVVRLWTNSVLDEATERAYPAMSFVAHPHCQSVLTDYWMGNFVGSPCAIPRSSIPRLLGQILIQVFFLGFPPSALCLVPKSLPDYAIFGIDDDATSAQDGSTEDDEFCRAYFSPTAERENGRAAERRSVGGGAARCAGVSPAERPRRSGGETVVVPEEEEEAQEAQEAQEVQEARSGCSLQGHAAAAACSEGGCCGSRAAGCGARRR